MASRPLPRCRRPFWGIMASTSVLLGGLPVLAVAQLESTGFSVTLNEIDYYISPFSSANVSAGLTNLQDVPLVLGLKPVTVVSNQTATADLDALFYKWASTDDVFNRGFLGAVFLAGVNAVHQQQLNGSATATVLMPLDVTSIPSGPYFLEVATGRLFPVYRLYADFASSFSSPLIQRPDGAFQPLSAQVRASSSLTVGVPSRLYYTRTAAKPLAGVRVGIKDIFALRGVKRSNGNRAWYQLYPAANETAPAIQRLLDAGAVVVGLQTPSQFANGQTATADWVDYHAPFNPRGDGYQDPSSSSSGGGASMASYDWLDMAIGSDTGGSIRGPAGSGGIFGNRPSHGLVTLDGVMPLSPSMDTVGFLLRDVHLWDAANRVLYQDNYTSIAKPTYPKRIQILDLPPVNSSKPYTVVLDGFVKKLQAFLGNATVEQFDIEETWTKSGPAEVKGASLDDVMGSTYQVLITKHQTRLLRDPFYQDYAAAFDGRLPFVDPVPLSRWDYGDSLDDSVLDDAIHNKTIFMDWFNSAVLPRVPDETQCSSSIMLSLRSSGSGTLYRNQYLDEPTMTLGFFLSRISPFAELPDSVFPVGQVSSESIISEHEEKYPVSVDVLVAKGCDGLLARLAADLSDAGVLPVPLTGRTIEGGVPAVHG